MKFKRSRKLKPCPLCGSKAMLTIHSQKIVNVSCGVEDDESDACGLVLFGGREAEMIEKWNKRTACKSDDPEIVVYWSTNERELDEFLIKAKANDHTQSFFDLEG